MTLRTRLVLGLLGIVAVGLIVSDVVTYRALRSFLYGRLDQQAADAVTPLASQLTGEQRRGLPRPSTISNSVAPYGTWAALIRPDGQVSAAIVVGIIDADPINDAPRPKFDSHDLGRSHAITLGGVDGGGRYRVVTAADSDGNWFLVALPLTDVTQTLRKLLGIEGAATVTVLAAVALLARWLVRRGMRPLVDIGVTADAIAAGDLSRRVEPADPFTEVGRLGMSLNSMLGQIETAFEAQQASEGRLRRFIADASHELRTPLTSIRGYAELFRRGAAERPEDLAKAMRRIEEEAARMGVLVDDLLLLARLDQGRPLERERVDLSRIATDAVDDARAVDPSRTIQLEAFPGVAVIGDDVRLRQVVGNLLTNARQHTPAGTPVFVRVGAGSGRASLEVTDHGPGLTSEQAARVFERFYRADDSRARRHGGTGLGLAIVAAIAEAHGGSVTVRTATGEGATFRVELPLATSAVTGDEPVEDGGEGPVAGAGRGREGGGDVSPWARPGAADHKETG